MRDDIIFYGIVGFIYLLYRVINKYYQDYIDKLRDLQKCCIITRNKIYKERFTATSWINSYNSIKSMINNYIISKSNMFIIMSKTDKKNIQDYLLLK